MATCAVCVLGKLPVRRYLVQGDQVAGKALCTDLPLLIFYIQ
jgi:hypothetical protein